MRRCEEEKRGCEDMKRRRCEDERILR